MLDALCQMLFLCPKRPLFKKRQPFVLQAPSTTGQHVQTKRQGPMKALPFDSFPKDCIATRYFFLFFLS